MPPSTPAPALDYVEPVQIPKESDIPNGFVEGRDTTGVRLIPHDTVPVTSGPVSFRAGDTMPSRDTLPPSPDDTDRMDCASVAAQVRVMTLHELALTTANLPTDRPADEPREDLPPDSRDFIKALLDEGPDDGFQHTGQVLASGASSKPAGPKKHPSGELVIDLNRPDLVDND